MAVDIYGRNLLLAYGAEDCTPVDGTPIDSTPFTIDGNPVTFWWSAQDGTPVDSWYSQNVELDTWVAGSSTKCFKLSTTAQLTQNISNCTGNVAKMKITMDFYTLASISISTKAYLKLKATYSDNQYVTALLPIETIQYFKTTSATIAGTLVSIYTMEAYIDIDVSKTITAMQLSIITDNLDYPLYIDNISLTENINAVGMKAYDSGNIVVDEYGVNPTYVNDTANLVDNSQFEVTDGTDPTGWDITGDGGIYTDDSYLGTQCIRLAPGASIEIAESNSIDASNYETCRTSFYCKGGTIKAEMLDYSDGGVALTLTDEAGNQASALSYTYTDWVDQQNGVVSRPNFSFIPGTSTDIRAKFTNTGSIDAYLDGIQVENDLSGKWPSTYTDGAYSTSASTITDLNQFAARVYIQPDLPSEAVEKDLWIDTDNYSRYDMTNMTGNISDEISGKEFIYTGTVDHTFTLAACTSQGGTIRIIKNLSTGILTVSGSIDSLASVILYPGECLTLIANGTVWCIT